MARDKKQKAPLVFLFFTGVSPCVASLPVFAAAAPKGLFAVVLSVVFFSLGVVTALVGATLLVSFGITKLDHPILEHHGDTVSGLAIMLMGLLLYGISF